MFPRSFSAVLAIVGVIWIIQGAGIVTNGSFMDGRPFWAVLGAALLVAGGAGLLMERRRKQAEKRDQSEV